MTCCLIQSRGTKENNMTFLYLVCLTLLGACSIIGQRIDQEPRYNQPAKPIPLRVISALAGIATIPLIISGFFFFPWWLPILGMLCVVIPGGIIAAILLGKGSAPGVGLLTGIAGLALAAAVIFGFVSGT